MPVDRLHAFATGKTYPARPVQWSPLDFLARLVARWSDRSQGRLAAASFARGAVLGPGVRVGPRAWCWNRGAQEQVEIGPGALVRGVLRCDPASSQTRLVIGEQVYIGDDCLISCMDRVEIGRLALLAHGVQVFDNDSHPLDAAERERDYQVIAGQIPGPRPAISSAPVVIGERAWISFNVIILKGVTVGEGAVIGAGSVVTTDVAPYTVVAGNPARLIREMPVTGDEITDQTGELSS